MTPNNDPSCPTPALKPLGILGGTFDPVHFAHLRLAQEALEQLGLAAVRWIPAGQPPHRHRPGASAMQRLHMVRLATASQPLFHVDPAEVQAAQPSFTVTTLRRLRAELGPAQPLVLLMGADAFLGLHTWHCWQELWQLAHIAVATRPGYELDERQLVPELAPFWRTRRASVVPSAPAGAVLPFTITPLAISATLIRATVAQGHAPRYLLPDAVCDYVQQQALYL